ncbi:MAG: hypothetical protein ABIW50_01465 [Candidatus Limnocylindria bacterium]
MRPSISIALIGVAFVLSACAEPVPASSAGESANSSIAPSASAGSAEPIPSDALAEFSCELPVVENGTVALANITDVRIGTHVGYDRVVFEFADGLPEMSLDRASPPFTHDASGMPIEVAGSSFLRLTLRGGTKQTEDFTSSYDGPTDFRPGLSGLMHLVEGGDFEAHSTWYFGLTSEACVRVVRLTDDGPARLVIDIES